MERHRRPNHAFGKNMSTVDAAQGGNRRAFRLKRGPGERLLDPSRELEVWLFLESYLYSQCRSFGRRYVPVGTPEPGTQEPVYHSGEPFCERVS